jgi:hypothetical protein
MSLPGASRGEYGPERFDLIPELGNASAVVHHHISRPSTICAAGLGGNPGLSLGATVPIPRHQSLDLFFMININSNHKIEILLLARFDQQGNHMDDDCRSTSATLQLRGSGADRRMHNPLEISARRRIGKNDLRETRAVEPTVGKDLRAESLDDRREPWSAGLDDLAGQYVGIDDDRTARRQGGGHQALPRCNAAG